MANKNSLGCKKGMLLSKVESLSKNHMNIVYLTNITMSLVLSHQKFVTESLLSFRLGFMNCKLPLISDLNLVVYIC